MGIGSSAGGLEALRLFVMNLPKDTNMVFLVAQHLSPQYRSMLADLLSRESTLPVVEVTSGITPKPNHIYIAPPNGNLVLSAGKLQLRKPVAEIGPKPSVDVLFSSLAEEVGADAVGIVMSGTGSDGAHGIRAIKSAGGICIAQQPDTAKYDSMPQAAIKTGVDLILPPDEIAKQLRTLVRAPRTTALTTEADESTHPTETLIREIYKRTRLDFSNYKTSTLNRQIERRMGILQIKTLEDYAEHIEQKPQELELLSKSMLVCVTSFFRDSQLFEGFRNFLPQLLEAKKPGDSIRIWVPGCATGEEAYSLAILVAEHLGDKADSYTVQIFATDINHDATQIGRKGVYSEAALSGIDEKLLSKYFHAREGQYQVDRRIRDMVVFAVHDLIQDPPFLRVDAVSCRNVLIYFKTGLQDKVIRLFHYALLPGGALFLGNSETIPQGSLYFSELDRHLKLYRKRDVPVPSPASFSNTPLIRLTERRGVAAKPSEVGTPQVQGSELLLKSYAPPSVLISGDGSILEFFGDVTPFTRLKDSRPDFNLFTILHPSLRTETKVILQKVLRTKQPADTQPMKMAEGETVVRVRAALRPIPGPQTTDLRVMVSLERVLDAPTSEEHVAASAADEVRLAELEHELALTRESMQTLVEELETSNEELQSLNEESQAANEELQATNEELETSNEELQATNEELTTVNDELSSRTIQLGEAMDDMGNILNSTGMAVLVIDRDLNIRRHNQAAVEFFKVESSIHRQNLTSIQWRFDCQGLLNKVIDLCKTPTVKTSVPPSREQNLLGKFSIEQRMFEVHGSAYHSADAQTTGGAVLTILDVSSHEKAERALALSQANLSNYMQLALAASYWEYDVGKDLFTFSDDFYRMMQTTVGAVGGYQISLKQYVEKFCHDVDADLVFEAFSTLKKFDRSEHSTELEHRFRLQGRNLGQVRLCFYLVEDPKTGAKKVYGVSQDVTEMRRSVAELQEAKRQAETANNAKTHFLSSMSHELRTPLNAIIGFSQLLGLNENLSTEQKEYIQHISSGGHHLLALITQILDLARTESRTLDLKPVEVPIDEMVESSVHMMDEMAHAKGLQVHVVKQLPKGACVHADETRTKQVLLNLISNAIKYTPAKGQITLSIERQGADQVRFKVADTGMGIPDEYKEQVFTPFNRLGVRDAMVEGTGIGLAISKNLVEMMGGSIGFDSEEGVGSTFWFDLPISTALHKQAAKAKNLLPSGKHTLTAKKGRILYVEDNQPNIVLVRAILSKVPGIELIVATNGMSGVEMCRKELPDLVLMDMQLPDMNGVEVTQLLKSEPSTCNIPVIGVSADAQKATIGRALSVGMVDYLTKPLRLDSLLTAIDQVLLNKEE